MTKQVSFSIFNSTFKRRGMGGNAYANIPSQDRDIASTAKLRGREMETQRSVVDCLVSWQTDLCVGLLRSEKSETECPCGESSLYE